MSWGQKPEAYRKLYQDPESWGSTGIVCFFQQPKGSDDGWWDGPGWYFSDETEQLHGPFGSRDEASRAQRNYAKDL
jgi:hypothetical protein